MCLLFSRRTFTATSNQSIDTIKIIVIVSFLLSFLLSLSLSLSAFRRELSVLAVPAVLLVSSSVKRRARQRYDREHGAVLSSE